MRHVAGRSWRIHDRNSPVHTTLEAVKKSLLRLRGISTPENFFAPSFERDIHDPMKLSDMAVAKDRIFSAIKKQEHILIYGDYDADGVSSTAILMTVLTRLGARVTPFLPHRIEQGYGLNEKVLRGLAGEIDLLIAVDCGITNGAEIEMLRKKNVATIVVDHHSLPDTLPPASAILHPRHPQQPYPFAWLCGAGLSWKLAQALYQDRRSGAAVKTEEAEKWLLDLALLGTVADVVPLLDENRAIVHFGLEVLKRTQRAGLRNLLLRSRASLTHLSARDVAFNIVPRLNAAGRMDHAQSALDLLLADNEGNAEEAGAVLESLNNRRRTLSRRVVEEAEAQLQDTTGAVLFAVSHDWPAGVVGLAAARLAERYGRPAVVVGQSGEVQVGSARSGEGSNLIELLTAAGEHLEKVGGHAHAAGFTVKAGQANEFKAALEQAALRQQVDAVEVVAHSADVLLSPDLLQRQTVDMLRQFAPFGEGNEQPLFVIRDLPLANWRVVGREGTHVKCSFTHEDSVLDGIAFGLASQMQEELAGQRETVDVLCGIEENEFRGRTTLQLAIQDIAPAGKVSITHS